MHELNIIHNAQREISFRAAHITDIHIKNLNANFIERYPAFKTKLSGHSIDVILNTGDTADSAGLTSDQSVVDFVADMNAIKPMITARGNHDESVTNSQLGMPVSNYYYQDIGDHWRIIVLYSQGGGNYQLGPTQTQWLLDTLAATPSDKFICIMSHVPILAVAALMWYLRNGQGWSNTVDFHSDAKDIIDIIKADPRIKVSLSGHEHTIDKVEHEGVVYLNSGAVCADWWTTNTYQEKGYPAGYRLIDFFDNGTIRESFQQY